MKIGEFEQLRALCMAATPGPWLATGEHDVVVIQKGRERQVVDFVRHNKDSAFIAAARMAVPELLVALMIANEQIEALQKAKDGKDELITAIRQHKDEAYAERDKVVALLSKCFPSHLCRHPDADLTWDNDWRWIVCIHLPTGQATWHIHDSEKPDFEHLQVEDNHWDGHNTEEKYRRLAAINAKQETWCEKMRCMCTTISELRDALRMAQGKDLGGCYRNTLNAEKRAAKHIAIAIEAEQRAGKAEAQCAAMREYISAHQIDSAKTCDCLRCLEGRRLMKSNEGGATLLAKLKRLEKFAGEVGEYLDRYYSEQKIYGNQSLHEDIAASFSALNARRA